MSVSFFRNNDASFARGVLSRQAYERGQKRSFISIQMCYMGWLFEVLASLCALFTAILKEKFDIPNTHFPDVIFMFLLIPMMHLMNDEHIKGVISEENWYQGIRYLLGIYKDPHKRRRIARHVETSPVKSGPVCPSPNTLPRRNKRTHKFHRNILVQKCNSTPDLVLPQNLITFMMKGSIRRNNSIS